MRGAANPRPESGLELYAWLFMRISGIALLFLAQLRPADVMVRHDSRREWHTHGDDGLHWRAWLARDFVGFAVCFGICSPHPGIACHFDFPSHVSLCPGASSDRPKAGRVRP